LRKAVTETCNFVITYSTKPMTVKSIMISAYPTISSDIVTVVTEGIQYPAKVFVYTSHGELIDVVELSGSTAGLDITRYPTGTYYLRLKLDNRLVSTTLVVMR